jgi:dCTP deaminase
MVLSERDIHKAMAVGDLVITPEPTLAQYAPSALDLRVGLKFWKFKNSQPGIEHTIDFDILRANAESYRNIDQFLERVAPDGAGTVTLGQNGFVLMETLERIELPLAGQLAARVEGRSSLARLGISVHMTAPTVHCGFSGTILLEVKNYGPFHLKIHPGKTAMCQIIFERVSSIPQGPLTTIFLNQDSPTGKSGS